jgi:hypothetical protein
MPKRANDIGDTGHNIDHSDHSLDAAEGRFRQLLASYGEPAAVEPPPDLVTRIGRVLTTVTPGDLARRARTRRAVQWVVLALFAALAVLGAVIVVTGGPASPLVGSGGSGLGRAILTVQLVLKPLVGTLSSVFFPMALTGLASAFAVVWLLQRRRLVPAST